MSRINAFALGGQDEIGKNCFVVEIDEKIYVLNCGIEIPPTALLGVKKLIPDYTWLQKNINRVAGVFFGCPTYENIGSLQYLAKNIKNIPIYTSALGKEILQTAINKYIKLPTDKKLNIIGLKPLRRQRIGNISVIPFKISNSMVGSVGWIFETEDGNIIYIDDFIVSHDRNHLFENNFNALHNINNKKNLLLLVGANNVGNDGFTIPKNKTKKFYEKIINSAPGRVFVACYENNTYSVFTLCQIAKIKKRPIIFYSDNFINLFNIAVKNKLFSNQHLLTLPISKINVTKNAIVAVTSTPVGLYSKLSKIVSGEDNQVTFQENDTFILGTQAAVGNESIEAKIIDEVARCNVYYARLSKDILPMKASDEDQKFLVNLLRPQYIVPISGLYKDFCKYSFTVYQTGFPKENIRILYNGEMLSFTNGQIEKKLTSMEVELKCIDNGGLQDVGSGIIFERNQMSENGAVIIVLYFDSKSGLFNKEIYHKSIGVTENPDKNKAVHSKVKELLVKKMEELEVFYKENGKNEFNLELKKTKTMLKNTISKIYTKICEKKPAVLPSIIEMENSVDDHKEIME